MFALGPAFFGTGGDPTVFLGGVINNFPITLTTSIFTGTGTNNFPIALAGSTNDFFGHTPNNFPIALAGSTNDFFGTQDNLFGIEGTVTYTFPNTGTYTVAVPPIQPGWTGVSMKVTALGGGGGGGGAAASDAPLRNPQSSGGGGGASVMTTSTYDGIIPDTTCTIYVALGGAGGIYSLASDPYTLPTSGSAGEASTVSVGAVMYTAPGGTGGGYGDIEPTPSFGGAGGYFGGQSGSTGENTQVNGGAGGSSILGSGGAGGTGIRYAAPGASDGGAGGVAAGGGGGGASTGDGDNNETAGNGGAGGNGWVRIKFYDTFVGP
jgi:hypothetical protein